MAQTTSITTLPPAEHRRLQQVACSSTFANDYTYEACLPWCPNNIANNCGRCKVSKCCCVHNGKEDGATHDLSSLSETGNGRVAMDQNLPKY